MLINDFADKVKNSKPESYRNHRGQRDISRPEESFTVLDIGCGCRCCVCVYCWGSLVVRIQASTVSTPLFIYIGTTTISSIPIAFRKIVGIITKTITNKFGTVTITMYGCCGFCGCRSSRFCGINGLVQWQEAKFLFSIVGFEQWSKIINWTICPYVGMILQYLKNFK